MEAAVNFDTMNKDELEEYARKHFGFELDKRRRIDDLVEQVKGLQTMKGKPKPVTSETAKKDRTPKTVRNIRTGVEWPWNPLYSGNADLEVIEWE